MKEANSEKAIAAADAQAAMDKKKFEVPFDIMEEDDTGTKYHTTHKCFGSPCPKDDAFVQVNDIGVSIAEAMAQTGQ